MSGVDIRFANQSRGSNCKCPAIPLSIGDWAHHAMHRTSQEQAKADPAAHAIEEVGQARSLH